MHLFESLSVSEAKQVKQAGQGSHQSRKKREAHVIRLRLLGGGGSSTTDSTILLPTHLTCGPQPARCWQVCESVDNREADVVTPSGAPARSYSTSHHPSQSTHVTASPSPVFIPPLPVSARSFLIGDGHRKHPHLRNLSRLRHARILTGNLLAVSRARSIARSLGAETHTAGS